MQTPNHSSDERVPSFWRKLLKQTTKTPRLTYLLAGAALALVLVLALNDAPVAYAYPIGGFDFSGFFQPVDNVPTLNQMNAGRSIPVKFSLGGDQGLDIFNDGYPASQNIPCDGSEPVDPVEETTTANSGLTYNAAADQYTYVWKTEKSWAGTCRQFILGLTDGSDHVALFKFK
jgi:hypothetical protein